MKVYSLADFGVTKHEIILQNGLKAIFIEKPFAPIFAEITIGAGSIFNPDDNGLAHFTEHVLVGASKKYPRKELFASIVNEVGGASSASTGLQTMAIECEVALPEHLVQMKEHFCQVLEEVYLSPKLLIKEKGVITAEITRKQSEPSHYFGLHVNHIFSQGTRWGYSNLGTIDSINALCIEDIMSFYDTHMKVENMILVICGGCTVDEIKKTFGDIAIPSGGRKSVLPLDPEPLKPGQRIFFEQDIEETNVGISFQGPILGTRESIIYGFVMSSAHVGLDSRFFTKLRNERGLVYGISFGGRYFQKLRYDGTGVTIPSNRTDETIDAILECYSELLKEGMTDVQVKDRINRRYFSEKRNMQKSKDWVNEFNDFYEELNPLIGDYPDQFNFWQTITAEEITDVLTKYISLDNFHLVINGRESSKKYF